MVWNDLKRNKSLASRWRHQDEHGGQVLSQIQELQAQGLSLRKIAEALSAADIAPPRDGWSHKAVKRILDRAARGFEEVPAVEAWLCPNSDCGAEMISRRLPGSDLIRAICLFCGEGQEVATL